MPGKVEEVGRVKIFIVHGEEFVFYCLMRRNWKILSRRNLDLIYLLKRNGLGAM